MSLRIFIIFVILYDGESFLPRELQIIVSLRIRQVEDAIIEVPKHIKSIEAGREVMSSHRENRGKEGKIANHNGSLSPARIS